VEDIIWTAGPKAELDREEFVCIYCVGYNNRRYDETVPGDGQENGRKVGPFEVWGGVLQRESAEGSCLVGAQIIPLFGQ